MTAMPSLGRKIRQLRKMIRLTQREFAERAQITYRHFQNIEGDKANIRLSTAEDIANSLAIPIQTLFDENCSVDLLGTGLKHAWDILELSPTGVCVVNLEGRIVYSNSFFKLNLIAPQMDIKSKSIFVWDLLPQENRQQGKLDFLKVIRERSLPKPAKRTYLGPGKKEIEVMITWDYIYDDKKKAKGFVSVVIPSNIFV